MLRRQTGFTIVELLIVIVVIGILAGIAILAWGGAITWSRDRARETDTRQWAGTFELYKSRFVVYPALPTSSLAPAWVCLGTFSSTGSKCGDYSSPVPGQYISDSSASTLLTNVAKIGKVQTNTGPTINNKYVGPVVYLTQDSDTSPITVTAHFLNYFQNNCPSDFTNVSATAPFSTLLQDSSAKLCDLQKTFTYSPG